MQRTGRFSFLLGAAQTCHYVGDAVSNLFGEYVAGRYGYLAAFKVLTILSVVPMFVYYIFMPGDHAVRSYSGELVDDPDKSTTGLKPSVASTVGDGVISTTANPVSLNSDPTSFTLQSTKNEV